MKGKKTPEHYNQTNFRGFGFDVHNIVFPITTCVVIFFVIFTLTFPDQAGETFGALRVWLTSKFDWVFIISTNFFILFCLAIIFSPVGKIRLGGTNARPEFSTLAWISMLFAAGLGIGLMFYGVYEPVNHFLTPPLGADDTDIAYTRELAMAATILHWALHPWAIYAVVGLAMAFFSYNHKLPLSVRSAFYPLLGEKIWGWSGHLIDILAVFATIFGIATSLGFGAEQSMAGLNYLFGISISVSNKVYIIIGITGVALISVLRGIHGGVKLLSEINIMIAAALCIFIFTVGPTLHIIREFFTNTINYIEHLPALSNWIGREDSAFLHNWTTFYWAWWMSWSPFVGMFIARISRGRTVREFLIGVLVIPSIIGIAWFTTFGGSAIDQYISDGYTGVIHTIQNQTPEMSIYKFLEGFPLSQVTSTVAVLLVCVFFITSMDSGALVIDTITAGGKLNTPKLQRMLWCVFIGLIAITLMISGGLSSLQAMALTTAFPFCAILLIMCYSTAKGLIREFRS